MEPRGLRACLPWAVAVGVWGRLWRGGLSWRAAEDHGGLLGWTTIPPLNCPTGQCLAKRPFGTVVIRRSHEQSARIWRYVVQYARWVRAGAVKWSNKQVFQDAPPATGGAPSGGTATPSHLERPCCPFMPLDAPLFPSMRVAVRVHGIVPVAATARWLGDLGGPCCGGGRSATQQRVELVYRPCPMPQVWAAPANVLLALLVAKCLQGPSVKWARRNIDEPGRRAAEHQRARTPGLSTHCQQFAPTRGPRGGHDLCLVGSVCVKEALHVKAQRDGPQALRERASIRNQCRVSMSRSTS
jgi:hypothetical protein